MGLLRSKEGLGHNFSPGLKRSGTLEGAERTQLTRSLPLSELRILAFSLSDVGSICRVVAEKKHGLLYALVGSFWLLC